MDNVVEGGGLFGKVNEYNIFLNRLISSCEVFDIGAPHIEKESFETVRFVMLMKARPNCPTHLIMALSLLSPTREILLTF